MSTGRTGARALPKRPSADRRYPTARTRWLLRSAMKKFPAPLTAKQEGELSRADVAAIPSPLYPAVPVPATVEITPDTSTFRTRWLPQSEM